MLPSITNVISLADSHDRAAFAMVAHVKQEPRERESSESKEEVRLRLPAELPLVLSWQEKRVGTCFCPTAKCGPLVLTFLPLKSESILFGMPSWWHYSEPIPLKTEEFILRFSLGCDAVLGLEVITIIQEPRVEPPTAFWEPPVWPHAWMGNVEPRPAPPSLQSFPFFSCERLCWHFSGCCGCGF